MWLIHCSCFPPSTAFPGLFPACRCPWNAIESSFCERRFHQVSHTSFNQYFNKLPVGASLCTINTNVFLHSLSCIYHNKSISLKSLIFYSKLGFTIFCVCELNTNIGGTGAREGVIIQWPLNGLFHDCRDVIIRSWMVVIMFPSNNGRYLKCRNFVILILEIPAISLD